MPNKPLSRSLNASLRDASWRNKAAMLAGVCALTALAGPICAQIEPGAVATQFTLVADPLEPYRAYPAVAVGNTEAFLPSYSAPMPRVAVSPSSMQPTQAPASMGASSEMTASSVGNAQTVSQAHGAQSHTQVGAAEASGQPTQPGVHARATGQKVAGTMVPAAGKGAATTTVTTATGKETVVAAPEVSPFHFTGSLGYYSLYMFRGLDVGHQTSIEGSNKNQGFLGASTSASYNDFALSFWFMNSLDPYVPGGAGFDGSFGKISKQRDALTGQMTSVYANQLDYHTPKAVRYQEYDLSPSYTFHLTPSLTFTPGVNMYFFNDGRFWAHQDKSVNFTAEAGASMNYTGCKYVNQSLSYYYDFEAFNGGFLEYRVSAPPIKLITMGQVAVGFVPSVGISYDFHYNNHASNGWNNVEPGVDIPVQLAPGLVLDFGAHYSVPLSNNRTDDRYWFTAAFQYTFPNAEPRPQVTEAISGKKTVVPLVSEGQETRWRFTTGAGIRNLSSNFHVGAAAGYYDGRTGSGDLFLATATQNANYNNGSVLSQSNPYYSLNFRTQNGGQTRLGDSDFVVQNPNQVSSPGTNLVQQVTYNSDRYMSSGVQGFNAKDTDSAASPFVSLGYSFYQGHGLDASVGLGYSYARSEMESGVRNTGISSALNYSFTYNVNPVWKQGVIVPGDSSNLNQVSLVYDGKQLINMLTAADKSGASAFPDLSPQKIVTTTPVAAFRGAKLDQSLNTMSIPFDLTFDLTSRIQARISAGPTLNFFDVDLTTTTDYQQLDSTADGAVKVYTNPVKTAGTVLNGNVNLNGVTLQASTTTTVAGPSATKGSSSGTTRALPGVNLAHIVNTSNTQKFTVGAFAEVALQFDLDSHKRWFAELYGRFDYVPKFTVADGASSATIDATSIGAGAGFGLRF